MKHSCDIAGRFWPKVDVKSATECWEWLGYKNSQGYGISSSPFTRRAHRIAFYLHTNREPSRDCVVMHTCDNPSCVNPHHLLEGSAADNAADRDRKGRFKRLYGESNGKSYLSCGAVADIYQSTLTRKELAAKHGCTERTVKNIRCGKTWGHLTKNLVRG